MRDSTIEKCTYRAFGDSGQIWQLTADSLLGPGSAWMTEPGDAIDGGRSALREGMTGTLRLVLGDQLSLDLSSLKDADKTDIILMCEVWDEATR